MSHSMGGSALSLNLYAYNYTCISPEGPKVRNSTRKSPKKTRRMKRRTIRRRKRYRNEAVVVCSMHARLSLVNQPFFTCGCRVREEKNSFPFPFPALCTHAQNSWFTKLTCAWFITVWVVYRKMYAKMY